MYFCVDPKDFFSYCIRRNAFPQTSPPALDCMFFRYGPKPDSKVFRLQLHGGIGAETKEMPVKINPFSDIIVT